MHTFTETQKNPFRWYLVAFSVVILFLAYWAIRSDTRFSEPRHYLLMLGVYSVVTGVMMFSVFRKITYQIDGQGIRYCTKPFGTWETIRWAEIERAYVRDITLSGEHPKGFAGARKRPNYWPYVINLGPDGRVYDIKGNFGLQINKKLGGKILIGTQRPDELQAFLVVISTNHNLAPMNTYTETQQNPYRWYVVLAALVMQLLLFWLLWGNPIYWKKEKPGCYGWGAVFCSSAASSFSRNTYRPERSSA